METNSNADSSLIKPTIFPFNNSPNNNTNGTGDSVREDVLRKIEHLGTFWI